MPDLNARDAKVTQYLLEALGKEQELETALQAHIAMTTRAPYRKRLQQHLSETKRHARDVERRIKQLGGDPSEAAPGPAAVAGAAGTVQAVARKGVALAKGPLHALRGTGEQEKMLKNAKTEYMDEAEEIATYGAIATLAAEVGDRETEQLARAIRREEERMSSFLERLIPTLTKAVARDEIPAPLRNGGRRSPRSRRRSATKPRRAGSRASSSSSSKSASRRRSARSRG